MERNDLKQLIFELLKNIAPDTDPQTLQPNQNIKETLDIDSFDYLNFIVALDEKLGIETPEEDYGRISTMDDLLNYIQLKAVH